MLTSEIAHFDYSGRRFRIERIQEDGESRTTHPVTLEVHEIGGRRHIEVKGEIDDSTGFLRISTKYSDTLHVDGSHITKDEDYTEGLGMEMNAVLLERGIVTAIQPSIAAERSRGANIALLRAQTDSRWSGRLAFGNNPQGELVMRARR